LPLYHFKGLCAFETVFFLRTVHVHSHGPPLAPYDITGKVVLCVKTLVEAQG
jgi:hypothetical protein